MATPVDVLHLKTDAELRFFVEHPDYYHPDLVAAARRELHRRPAIASPDTAAAPIPVEAAPSAATFPGVGTIAAADEAAPATSWRWLLSVALVLAVAGLGFWKKQAASTSVRNVKPVPPARRPAPKLESVIASPLPTYNAEAYADSALALVPASEHTNAQLVSQYRAIARRFWAAQKPSDYLIQQAQHGQAPPVFMAQANFVLGLWHDFDRAMLYSYQFGPVMADHLARMRKIARYQRTALADFTSDAAAKQPLALNDAQRQSQQLLPSLLAPLARKTNPTSSLP